MRVALADLPAQHQKLMPELTTAFEEVMGHCHFILGENVKALEAEIAESCGNTRAFGLNSGTDALLLALRALGIGPGDEVITTPFTFVATAETICLTGATPVFADIDPKTFNLDPGKASDKITSKTKAIMPVHLFGQIADMEQFGQIAKTANIGLIGDGAQAIGATYHGKKLGELADLTTLSFFPTKNLGACGDGGMVLTDHQDYAEQIRLLRFHGSGGGYIYKEIGYCSRLDELQAAFLRVKSRYLSAWNDARRTNAARYNAGLAALTDYVILPTETPNTTHIYHQYTMRVPNGKRDALQQHLKSLEIQSAIYYPLSLHLQEAYLYLGGKAGDFSVSEAASHEVLSLPIHPDVTAEQIDYVINSICEFFG